MKAKVEAPESSKAADTFKWLIALVLLTAAIVGNHIYAEMSVVIRASAVVVLAALALGIASLTTKGKSTLEFAREARMEVRKVVWPTRQETVQTTFIVLAVCMIAALILWVVDAAMVFIVDFITRDGLTNLISFVTGS